MGDNAMDKAKGKAKEMMGKASGDDRRSAEGKTDQAKGKAKDAADDMRDKAEGMRDSFREDH
ncbi:CsbD family protein [Streptomyces sp. NPDC020607]|uniref:CsbD family protein n=1 Tax=Streptomyces sp. NPDC020607 TaxID=3365082 RepID=UPI00379B74CB